MIRKFSMATVVLMAATGSALAADLPSRRPPPVFVPPPLFTWTGVYVGGQIGYAWGSDKVSVPFIAAAGFGDFASASPQGLIGGGHIGYNYQVNQFVLGLEGDVEGTDIRNNIASFGTGTVYGTRVPLEASIRGRLGYAWDRTLFYVTGGAAFGDINHTYTSATGFVVPVVPGAFSRSSTKVGWTVGAGVEYALSNNWSVRGEYRYTDFSHQSDLIFGTFANPSHHLTEHAVRVGFSYKFDMYAPPAPVVAKY
jgi:outer membrane immunogenic protein